MRNTFISLLNRAGAMKGRLLLGAAGILCAIMVGALVAPVLTPHTQGSVAPQKELVFESSPECSAMMGCVSEYLICKGPCFYKSLIFLVQYPEDCCPLGVDGGGCMYCD